MDRNENERDLSANARPADWTNPKAEGRYRLVIIGAGPAGLTAAYELGKVGHTATVLESDRVVGGISRTVERDGWRFGIVKRC